VDIEIEFEMDAEQLEYEQDKVINGVLHYLDGDQWVEYSKEELTEKLLEEQDFFNEYVDLVYSSTIN
jgi:hypothetical protein